MPTDYRFHSAGRFEVGGMDRRAGQPPEFKTGVLMTVGKSDRLVLIPMTPTQMFDAIEGLVRAVRRESEQS